MCVGVILSNMYTACYKELKKVPVVFLLLVSTGERCRVDSGMSVLYLCIRLPSNIEESIRK